MEPAAVIDLERRLLDPDVRGNRAALAELLHDDFREFGASGRVYDRDEIIDALLAEDGAATPRAFDFQATRLGPDAVPLTYRTESPSLRTSVWMRGGDGTWRVLHHHGTRAEDRR